MVVAALREVRGELSVGERVGIDRLQLPVLGDRRGLEVLVPVAKLLAPELVLEGHRGALEALRNILGGDRNDRAVPEAVDVLHLAPLDEQPVEGAELAEAALERLGVHLGPVARDGAREVDRIDHPRAGAGRFVRRRGGGVWGGHESSSSASVWARPSTGTQGAVSAPCVPNERPDRSPIPLSQREAATLRGQGQSAPTTGPTPLTAVSWMRSAGRLLSGESDSPACAAAVLACTTTGESRWRLVPRPWEAVGVSDWSPIRYARNGDVAIAFSEIGSGDVDVLVIGGFVTHLEIVPTLPIAARFWERMASFARVVAFDKRGMGLSDRDAGGYTLENIADDAIAVLDAAGVERAAVFGISEGGPASIMLAAAHPERVSALIQYGSFARVTRAPDYPEGAPAQRIREYWEHMRANWGESGAADAWAPSLAGDAEVRDWWGRLLRSGLSPGGVPAVLEMYESVDVRPLLPAIRAPTLVLYRTDDLIVRPPLPRTIARGIPGAREVELEGADHLYCAGDQNAMLDEIERFLTGGLATAPADRVLATLLFTDIVGSTERAAELGDRQWRELLERHDRLGEREVGRNRGRVVKTTGDGLLASFDGPARAVRAGLALRDDAATALGVQLRVGVHTGECEAIGDDLGGIGVHIAARVQTAAKPGEVLVSSTVKDLVVGSGLRFGEPDEHELKGVPGVWRLHAVVGDDGHSMLRPFCAPRSTGRCVRCITRQTAPQRSHCRLPL